jgi:hypothetical protein
MHAYDQSRNRRKIKAIVERYGYVPDREALHRKRMEEAQRRVREEVRLDDFEGGISLPASLWTVGTADGD